MSAVSAWQSINKVSKNLPIRLSFGRGCGGTSFLLAKRKGFPHKKKLLLAGAFWPDDVAASVVAGIVPVARIDDCSGVAAETAEDENFVVFPAALGGKVGFEAIELSIHENDAVGGNFEGIGLFDAGFVVECESRRAFGFDVSEPVDEWGDGIRAVWGFDDHLVAGVDKAGFFLVCDARKAVACACHVEFFVSFGDLAEG